MNHGYRTLRGTAIHSALEARRPSGRHYTPPNHKSSSIDKVKENVH